MRSAFADASVVLWLVSSVTAVLAGRAFVEYLRRLLHDGPQLAWRELVFASLSLAFGLWGSMVLDIAAQGLTFEVGFHPFKTFGSLLAVALVIAPVLAAYAWRPRWYMQLAAAVLLAVAVLILQVATIWSIGAEPGLFWRREPLVFAGLLLCIGLGVAARIVSTARRGSKADRRTRRLLSGLVLGAFVVAAQELVLAASGLDRQMVSAHARFLPDVIITLLAGAVVPIGLVMLIADQRSQQRARASDRARRKLAGRPDAGESVFSDSLLSPGLTDPRKDPSP
jgi:NO-binding membrane sensor protein with MHYT domain